MIKVVNIISDSNIGGAGKCVLTFCDNYNREKFDLTVIIPKGSKLVPELQKRDVKYIECNNIADCSLSFKGILSLKRIIKEIKPHVVHTHASMSGRIAATLVGVKKVIYTLHCVYEPSVFSKSFVGKIINKIVSNLFSTHIIAVAEEAKNNLVKCGINPKKIKVILNGIIPVKINNDKESLKNRFNIKDGEKVVSIIARLEEVKGHKYFIEAARILKDKGYCAKFIIAGNGSYEEEIRKYSEINGNPVDFTGFISDPENLISVTDISVNACFGTEATSISLLEGMSAGIPAVVSNYGGNPGVIQDGVNGYLFHIHNSEELAEKLEILLGNEDIYNKMSANAIKVFNETFTADIYTKNIENMYYPERKEW